MKKLPNNFDFFDFKPVSKTSTELESLVIKKNERVRHNLERSKNLKRNQRYKKSLSLRLG